MATAGCSPQRRSRDSIGTGESQRSGLNISIRIAWPSQAGAKFLVNRVSIALGNIVTFPGRRPSEDPSPALGKGNGSPCLSPFQDPSTAGCILEPPLLKIPRPLSAGEGKRRGGCFLFATAVTHG